MGAPPRPFIAPPPPPLRDAGVERLLLALLPLFAVSSASVKIKFRSGGIGTAVPHKTKSNLEASGGVCRRQGMNGGLVAVAAAVITPSSYRRPSSVPPCCFCCLLSSHTRIERHYSPTRLHVPYCPGWREGRRLLTKYPTHRHSPCPIPCIPAPKKHGANAQLPDLPRLLDPNEKGLLIRGSQKVTPPPPTKNAVQHQNHSSNESRDTSEYDSKPAPFSPPTVDQGAVSPAFWLFSPFPTAGGGGIIFDVDVGEDDDDTFGLR